MAENELPQPDVVIVEVGGTVGDIESLPFLEAIRQMKNDVGRNNVCYVHLTLVPYVNASEEFKSKPTQHSVNQLRSIGIQPDAIIARSEKPIGQPLKEKIALFGDVTMRAVINVPDASSIYQVPLMLEKRGSAITSSQLFGLKAECTGSHRVAGTCGTYRGAEDGSAHRSRRQVRRDARRIYQRHRIIAACGDSPPICS